MRVVPTSNTNAIATWDTTNAVRSGVFRALCGERPSLITEARSMRVPLRLGHSP